MRTQADRVLPSRLATSLLKLFVTPVEVESIIGDLTEEFPQVASASGVAKARRWYWRQILKTTAHLAGAGLCVAPWSMLAAVIGGFLMRYFVTRLPGTLLTAVTDRYLPYWSAHFHAYVWLLRAVSVAYLMLSMLVGGMVALAAKERELIATGMLSLLICALIAVSLPWLATLWPLKETLVWLLWQCADPFAILMGGAIVRTWRSGTRTPLTSS
jgi:hypothetical protein